MSKFSIKDVAKMAGVSIASVSYVLNQKTSKKISSETAAKIHKAAATLGYRPNRIAKSLKTKQTHTIGFIVADITNLFFSELAHLIEEYAVAKGYTLLVASANEEGSKFESLVDLFMDQQVDGLILAPVEHCEDVLEKLIQLEFPFILLDRYFENVSCPSIHIDNYSISNLVGKTLLKSGVRFPLFVSYKSELQNLKDRLSGFESAFAKDQIQTLEIGLSNIKENIYQGLDYAFSKKEKPDAIFFSSNKLSFAGLNYLLDRNISIPDQVQVVAFDYALGYEFYPTSLSYVQQPLPQLAKAVFENLQKILSKEIEQVSLSLEAELILNDSVLA